VLVGMLALAGVRALSLCELPVPLFVVVAAAVLAFAVRDVLGRGDTLLGRDERGRWHLARPGDRPFTGRLVEAGYRGAAFVVVVLERHADEPRDSAERSSATEAWRDGRLFAELLDRLIGRGRRHVTVFADSVAPRDFSRLHFELALAAGDDPSDRPSHRR